MQYHLGMRSQQGFVLVAVLWILVIMVLAATAFSLWVDRVRDQAFMRQQQVGAYQQSTDILTKILYTYMTGIKTSEGIAWPSGDHSAPALGVQFDSLDDFMAGAAPKVNVTAAGFMRMDDGVLDTGYGLRIMIQDHAGLIGMSFLSDQQVFDNIAKFSGSKLNGVRLKDTLYDYQDTDSQRKLQGAESHDYRQQGLPPPINGYLRSPLQLRSVIGWNDALSSYDDAWILRVFRAEGTAAINVNTASESALRLVLGNEDKINSLLNERELRRYDRLSDLAKFVGGAEDISLSILPSAGFRFWWWHEGDTTARVYDVQFSPLDSGAKAWYFNWTARVTLPDDLAKSTAIKIDHPFFH
jgi:hypothetical protein